MVFAAPIPPGELTVAFNALTADGTPHHVAWIADAFGNHDVELPAAPDQMPTAVTGMTRYASAVSTLNVNEVTSGPTKAIVLSESFAAR